MPIGSNASAIYSSFYAAPTITGAGSAQYLGVRVNASSTGAYTGSPIAGDFTFTQNGSGTIASGRGVSMSYGSAAGTTTTAYGIDAGVSTTGGAITKGIGVGISSIQFGGTITTMVGLDIGVTTSLVGSTIWGVQVGTYNSFFNGKTTFNANGTPTWGLHLQNFSGSGSASNALGMDVSRTAPTSPASSAAATVSVYKGSGGTNIYLLVAFNDAGTVRYRSMQLNGTTALWVEGTSLPT